MHVVIAGGGSAGHIEPALAFADALRRRDPSVEVTALGTERGLDTRLIPARGYDLVLIPPVPIPRRPAATCSRCPAGCGPRSRAAADGAARAGTPTCWSASAASSSGPAYLAARRLRVPIVVHEANPRPGWANRLGARLTPYVATTFPGTPIAHGRHVGLPIRRSIATLDRAATRAEARAHLRAGRRPADAAGDRRLAGRPAAQRRGLRRGRRTCAPPASRCCTRPGTAHTVDGRDRGRAPPYVVRALPRPDGPRLRRRRPGAVPGRGQHGRRADRGRAAGGVRPAADRQRRAGADRPPGGRGRRRPARRRRRLHRRLGARRR